jgi:hypothetical protein
MDLAVIPPGAHNAPPALLTVVLVMAVLVGLLDGAGQGALYGEASLLPPEYTHVGLGSARSARAPGLRADSAPPSMWRVLARWPQAKPAPSAARPPGLPMEDPCLSHTARARPQT